MKGARVDHNCLPNKEVHHFNTMIQLLELKKLNKAFKICEQILKKYPKNGETLSAKGYILNLMDENNKEDAFKFAKEGIRNNLNSYFCWYILGCLNKKHKNYEEALKCFTKAIKFNPSDQKSLREVCLSLLYLKKFEQFKEVRWNIYKGSLKNIRDKSFLLFAFHLAKDYNACIVLIKEIEANLAIHHDLTEEEKNEFLIYISEILLEAKQYDECIDFVNNHEKDLFERSWCFQILGLAYLYKECFMKANYYFKKCFELNQENVIILLLLMFTERECYIDRKESEKQLLSEEIETGTCRSMCTGTDKDRDTDRDTDRDRDRDKDTKTKTEAKEASKIDLNKKDVDEKDVDEKEEKREGSITENKNKKGRKTLSDLFYLDYKMEHTKNTKVKITENTKFLLHECILNIYGPDKNMKFMSEKRKNVLNDYICHNWEMDKYDVYSCTELENFVNTNFIEKEKFLDDVDLKQSITDIDINTFIEQLKRMVEEEKEKKEQKVKKEQETNETNDKKSSDITNNDITNNDITNNDITNNDITNNNIINNDITNNNITDSQKNMENSNNIIWSKKLGTDFVYHCKKRIPKCSDIRYIYKIKNLDAEEEICIENYFTNLQKEFPKSKLLQLFPLHVYSEKKFAFYINKIIVSFCSKQKTTIFQNIKSLLTFKNISILIFLLKKYIFYYEATGELWSLSYIGDEEVEKGEMKEQKEIKEIKERKEIERKDNKELKEKIGNREQREQQEDKEVKINKEREENNFEKREDNIVNLENNEKIEYLEKKGNNVDNVIKRNEDIKGKKGIKIMDLKSETEKENENVEKLLKEKPLTENEKKEAFIVCITILLIHLYDYINYPEKAVMYINKTLKSLKYEVNAHFRLELIYMKGLLYKRNGAYIESLKYLEKCRMENKDDRCINTKCCKVYFTCGFVKSGRKTAAPFVTPGGNSFDAVVKDTQIFWIEHGVAMAYICNHPNIHVYKYMRSILNNKKNTEQERNSEIEMEMEMENSTKMKTDMNNHNVIFDNNNNNNNSVIFDKTVENVVKHTVEDSVKDIVTDSTKDTQNIKENSKKELKTKDKNDEQVEINIKALIEQEIINREKLDDFSRGLNLLHAEHKHYLEICSDQATFYPYATRKLLFRSFVHLLYLTANLYSCATYRKIGKRIIRVLLELHDYYKDMENEGIKKKKKKKKTPSDSTTDETDPYEYIKNDPLDNAMIYMETFLSQPNIDLSVYRLHYEIMRRKKVCDFPNMIETLLTMKCIFPYHLYHYQMIPAVSHFLCKLPISTLEENVQKNIGTKLNELLSLTHVSYDEKLLKQVRIDYLKNVMKFCMYHRASDLRYFQAVLEAYISCEEKIAECVFSSFKMDPTKNKMNRCFKFLKFLIINEKKIPEFTQVLKKFKSLCREVYPFATAFQ